MITFESLYDDILRLIVRAINDGIATSSLNCVNKRLANICDEVGDTYCNPLCGTDDDNDENNEYKVIAERCIRENWSSGYIRIFDRKYPDILTETVWERNVYGCDWDYITGVAVVARHDIRAGLTIINAINELSLPTYIDETVIEYACMGRDTGNAEDKPLWNRFIGGLIDACGFDYIGSKLYAILDDPDLLLKLRIKNGDDIAFDVSKKKVKR
jgi:hypothetical protein